MKRTSFVLMFAAVVATLLSVGCGGTMRNDPLRLGFKASEGELWDEALLRWEKAVELAPRSVSAHNNLAVAYEKKARWEDARKEYEKALELDPSNLYVKHNFDRFRENMDVWKAGAEKTKGGDADEK
ncbi:MAG TPA: tetratricopeptide repeat protein [Acidobacteriota bacterium]|nr:tetratricopeptide repeat protein [Acidobacteriota bacterium]